MEGEDIKQTSFDEVYTEKQNNSFKEFFRNLDRNWYLFCFDLYSYKNQTHDLT